MVEIFDVRSLVPTIFMAALLVATTALRASPAGAEEAVTIDGIAATVNGEVITLLDLEKAGRPGLEKRLAATLKREQAKVRREVLLSVLDQMILRTLQRQKATELGLRVSDQEIEAAIGRIMETNALTEEMLERALLEEGLSREDYREQISDQILITKLMQREVREKLTVTPEEIAAYYRENQEKYFQPERIRVRHLLVKVAADASAEQVQEGRRNALEILKKHREGADFSSLVSEHSSAGSASGEAVSGWLTRGEFLPELEEVAFSLPAGQVSEPIRSQAGFHLIQVVERRDESHLSLASVADSIEDTLLREKMDRGYKEWLETLRKESQIDILY